MKKIALILMIAALSVFVFAAFVSADGNRYKKFHGVYEMSLKGNGLNSLSGFADPIYPDPDNPEIVVYFPNSSEGVWGSTPPLLEPLYSNLTERVMRQVGTTLLTFRLVHPARDQRRVTTNFTWNLHIL